MGLTVLETIIVIILKFHLAAAIHFLFLSTQYILPFVQSTATPETKEIIRVNLSRILRYEQFPSQRYKLFNEGFGETLGSLLTKFVE